MSYEIVKSIAVTKDKVFLTGADSSLHPLHFHRWECEPLTKILREQGREALYATLGEDVWNGNIHLRQGNKLCRLFLEARSAFPRNLHFSNFDSKAAGGYLGRMVSALEQNPNADLSSIVSEALTIRNDRDYILDAAKRSGYNFLDFASEEVQSDRAFALKVLHAGSGRAWFRYPNYYNADKDFAMEALKLNGCFYRELNDSLKADREIILEAFRESETRRFHEHLPDLIPVTAYFKSNAAASQSAYDTEFLCDLLDKCPSMHMSRAPWLLQNREIVEKWVQVGRFFPHSVTEVPKEYLQDKKIQSLLCKRFEGTDKYAALMQRFADVGIQLPHEPLAQRINAVSSRTADQHPVSAVKRDQDSPER